MIVKSRFDPNENIDVNGVVFHQELDWVRLTEVDRITQGESFPIRISLNELREVVDLTFYYTTDPVGDPFQSVAMPYTVTPPPSSDPFLLYLPLVSRDYNPVPNEVAFMWDTGGVAPSTYYICVTANDGYNEASYCSEAPVDVLSQ